MYFLFQVHSNGILKVFKRAGPTRVDFEKFLLFTTIHLIFGTALAAGRSLHTGNVAVREDYPFGKKANDTVAVAVEK